VLPADYWVHGVTPGRVFCPARISAKVVCAGHLREDVFGCSLCVWLPSEPLLARYPTLGDIGLALIIATIFFDTVGCNIKSIIVEQKLWIENL